MGCVFFFRPCFSNLMRLAEEVWGGAAQRSSPLRACVVCVCEGVCAGVRPRARVQGVCVQGAHDAGR